jgi:hypothetical protein
MGGDKSGGGGAPAPVKVVKKAAGMWGAKKTNDADADADAAGGADADGDVDGGDEKGSEKKLQVLSAKAGGSWADVESVVRRIDCSRHLHFVVRLLSSPSFRSATALVIFIS